MPSTTATGERGFFRAPPLRLTLPIVAAAAGLALIFWTLPNAATFVRNVAQFPALWQEESNRQVIILLSVKVFSWLILALLLWGWCWLVYSAWCWLSYPSGIAGASLPAQQPFSGARAHSALTGPITPLPPTLSYGSPPLPGLQPSQVTFTVAPSGHAQQTTSAQMPVYIAINLLERVQVVLSAPGLQGQSRDVDLKANVKRTLLLAYIAWLQGKKVPRDKLINAVFLPGRTGPEAEPESLVQAFNDQKKAIRQFLREAITTVNQEAGREVVPTDLDVFANANMYWWLDPRCRVVDIETIEAQHRIIEQAEQEGRLANRVTAEVNEACQTIIRTYRGDFLARLIADYPREFAHWGGQSSWVRRPFTQCRDYYLQALWYAAGYELQLGQQQSGVPVQGIGAQETLYAHFERAARLYRNYALYACNTSFDMKVPVGRAGSEPTERVGMSECALRYCLLLYSASGNRHPIDQIYADYVKQMKRIVREWEPAPETKRDLDVAKSGAIAFRLPLPLLPHGPFPSNLQPPAGG